MEHHRIRHKEVQFLRVPELRRVLAGFEVNRLDLLPLVVLMGISGNWAKSLG
jgi:hypothetical protein